MSNRKYEYELFLREGDEEGEYFVDLREDIVEFGDTIDSEYIEGFIIDNYTDALKKFNELGEQVERGEFKGAKLFICNEVAEEIKEKL